MFLPQLQEEQACRYPIVYALHGHSIGAEQWTHEIHVSQTIEGAFAQNAKETIVVLPDSMTVQRRNRCLRVPSVAMQNQCMRQSS